MRLVDNDPPTQTKIRNYPRIGNHGIDHVLLAYGLRRLFSDVDAGRDFLASRNGSPSIVAAVLDWIAGEGFSETFQRLGGSPENYASARAYRERYLMATVRGLIESGLLHRH